MSKGRRNIPQNMAQKLVTHKIVVPVFAAALSRKNFIGFVLLKTVLLFLAESGILSRRCGQGTDGQ